MVLGIGERGSSGDFVLLILYYLVGFILVMAAPILVVLIYGSATPQILTFSFILYAILAGIVEGMISSPVIAASIDVALILIVVSNYACIRSTLSEGMMKANISIWPLIVAESYGGHMVIAPDFSQLALLTLLYIHRRGVKEAVRLALLKLKSAGRKSKEI